MRDIIQKIGVQARITQCFLFATNTVRALVTMEKTQGALLTPEMQKAPEESKSKQPQTSS